MSAADMNNADQIKEKTNSLNVLKINNFLQQAEWSEGDKKKDLQKHVSILSKYTAQHQAISYRGVHSRLDYRRQKTQRGDNAQNQSVINIDLFRRPALLNELMERAQVASLPGF
jgi:hypothetical protein